MRRWFILNKGQVSGPFEADQVSDFTNNAPDSLLWSRGEMEWINIDRWNHLQSLSPEASSQSPTIAANSSSLNKSQPNHGKSLQNQETLAPTGSPHSSSRIGTQTRIIMNRKQEMWRISIGMKEYPPMTYTSMLNKLKEVKDFTGVSVFNTAKNEWAEVFSFEEVVEDLGISRRSHDRVPIMGTFTGEHEKQGAFQARVISISEGGFGLGDAKNVQIGDIIKGIINSPNLFTQISCAAEVVYLSPEGLVGVSFTSIGEEAKSAIIEYVRKFSALKK